MYFLPGNLTFFSKVKPQVGLSSALHSLCHAAPGLEKAPPVRCACSVCKCSRRPDASPNNFLISASLQTAPVGLCFVFSAPVLFANSNCCEHVLSV